jgi:superoxide dismutase
MFRTAANRFCSELEAIDRFCSEYASECKMNVHLASKHTLYCQILPPNGNSPDGDAEIALTSSIMTSFSLHPKFNMLKDTINLMIKQEI